MVQNSRFLHTQPFVQKQELTRVRKHQHNILIIRSAFENLYTLHMLTQYQSVSSRVPLVSLRYASGKWFISAAGFRSIAAAGAGFPQWVSWTTLGKKKSCVIVWKLAFLCMSTNTLKKISLHPLLYSSWTVASGLQAPTTVSSATFAIRLLAQWVLSWWLALKQGCQSAFFEARFWNSGFFSTPLAFFGNKKNK